MSSATESASPPGRMALQIGDWTVEPTLNQLSAAGKTVKLEPKAMAVLVYLAERPGEVVSREALLSAVWSGTVVGDDSLSQVILKLRKALGNVSSYIQTISKGGYRLVAPVVRSTLIAPAEVPAHARSVYADRKRRVRWMTAAGVAVLLLAAGGICWIKYGAAIGTAPDRAYVASAVAARTVQPTVAIRPFEPLGDDPQEVLLARGITADLGTDLSKVFGLSVIDLATTGRQAGGEMPTEAPPIRYLVSGSVQRIDDRLRVHVHLTDAGTGRQLWSERFDRSLSAFFAIQEELGPKLLLVLPAKVSEAEMRRVAQPHTRNLEAYEYFQRGQSALRLRQKAENETAREMFQRAIELDATFARAYAGLGRTYAAEYRHQWTADGPAALARAFEIARTAYEINPDIPETHWVLAYVHMERRQHEQALRYLATALRLYPSFADGYALMGAVHAHIGRPAGAVGLVRTAMRLNPEGTRLYFSTLGRAYLFLGDLEQARVNLEHALSRDPANVEAHVYMAALHVTAGDKAAAAWEAEEIRALQPRFSSRSWLETYPMTDVAQKTTLVKALSEVGF
ncbi:MAG: winged helix-turn-helix domain-containing tetratricopeptide repeat protein [Burkholderiales bacterium]